MTFKVPVLSEYIVSLAKYFINYENIEVVTSYLYIKCCLKLRKMKLAFLREVYRGLKSQVFAHINMQIQ